MDLAVPTDQKVKIERNWKKDKYLDFARESKKLWNMKVTIISIVIGAFGKVTKALVQGQEDLEIRGRWRPFKLQHYWDRIENWQEFRRLEVTCCLSNSNERPSANANAEKLSGSNILIIKRTCCQVDFADHKVKIKKSEKRDKYLDFMRELRKLWNMKVMVVPIVYWGAWNNSESLERGRKSPKWRTNWNHPKYSIVEKRPVDLRRLAVSRTPANVRVRKTRNGNIVEL